MGGFTFESKDLIGTEEEEDEDGDLVGGLHQDVAPHGAVYGGGGWVGGWVREEEEKEEEEEEEDG